MRRRIIALIGAGLLLAGCASSLDGAAGGADNAGVSQIRTAGGLLVIAEVATDGVLFESPEDAVVVDSLVAGLADRIEAIRTSDGRWVHAERFDSLRSLARQTSSRIQDRILSFFGIGFNYESALGLAAKAGKAGALVRDLRAMYARHEAGEMTDGQVWAAIDARLAWNRSRLKPFLTLR